MPTECSKTWRTCFIYRKASGVTCSKHSDLQQKTVEFWGQIVNIYQRPFLFHHSSEIDKTFRDLCMIRNINLSWSKPLRPLSNGCLNRWNTAICSIPTIVTLQKVNKVQLVDCNNCKTYVVKDEICNFQNLEHSSYESV